MRATTIENVAMVDKLVLSHEDQLQIYRSTCQIPQLLSYESFFTVSWLEEVMPAADPTDVIHRATVQHSDAQNSR